ncbi:MAG: choice-of-anchor D domain-containing protein [Desulfocapsaceae bacterium]|nr:choice-of-anchor D domain-containing protein [Desulfocapsaceae bacterium]
MKKEKLGTSVFFSLLILLLAEIACTFGATALAATMPVFEPLPSIDAQVDKPTAVTVDAQGRLYVAESENNWVRVFTQGGQYLATLTGLAKPISVAVDAAGRIYVGSASLGNVTVFAADFTKQLKLGNGDGEFIEPADIDIDSSGQIYVVDKDNNTVRVYNTAGVLLKSIGTRGNGNGQLYHPTSLAIDPVSFELVIIDHPQIWDDFSQALIDGARIQFLGMDGTFHRGYPKFGYNMNAGQLVKPMQVAVDPDNRIYVSESRWQKVMVYGKDGVFLGMIDNSTHPLRTPLGLFMAASSRLYVASLLGEKVDVYGIDAHSAMSLAPSTLNFTTTEGGNAPDPQNVTIKNSGKQALTWTAGTTADWLNLDPTVGTLEPTKTGVLAVGVKNTGLAQGTYQGSISIMVLGMTEKVAVTLTVKPNPLLVSPDSLSFTTTTGTNPVTQPLSVTNAGTDKLNWSATADQPWLKLSKATGHAPDQIEIDADVSNLALGTHTATITFINDSTGGSVLVPVSLSITKPNPLQVSPASLSFTTTKGTNPSPQPLSVANAETDPLHWSTTADQSWLKLSKATGSAPDQVTIGADISTLKPGTHTATITFINDSTGCSVLVPVSLSISEPNPLQVSPARLSLTTTKETSPSTMGSTKGTNLSSLTLSGIIEGKICPPLNWTATADQSWLKLSKGTGATPDQVKIVADISALALGPHTATITFINNSTGGSVLVPVSLNVNDSNPLLVSPARLSFKTKTGTIPSTLALSVANAAGKAPLEWNAAANQSWLKISKDKGSTPDDKVEINADASALAPGTYTGTITFSSTSGNVLVPVTLRVGTFPWLIIIQDIAIIGEQLQKQDKENKSKTSKDQKPAKISGPEAR